MAERKEKAKAKVNELKQKLHDSQAELDKSDSELAAQLERAAQDKTAADGQSADVRSTLAAGLCNCLKIA